MEEEDTLDTLDVSDEEKLELNEEFDPALSAMQSAVVGLSSGIEG